MKTPFLPYVWLLGMVLFASAIGNAFAQEDPGRGKLGMIEVTVYFATDGDPGAAGPRAQEISMAVKNRLRSESRLKYSHYRALGADTQPVFRSYENWAQPLKPSDEILVRFETKNLPGKESVSIDFELWLAKKKILKTDVLLRQGHPLFVLGPEWRGGRLIIAVALAS